MGKRSKGLALIMVVSILVGLSILATLFVMLTSSSRDLSISIRDRAQADLLAQSGVEQAKTILLNTAFKKAYSSWGDTWVTQNALGDTGHGASIETMENPSFRPWTAADQGVVTLDGITHYYSGKLQNGTYAADGDLWKIKVLDTQSMICLNNDPVPESGYPASLPTYSDFYGADLNYDGVNDFWPLASMLQSLGAALVSADATFNNPASINPFPAGFGVFLMDFRDALPHSTFSDLVQLQDAMQAYFDAGLSPWPAGTDVAEVFAVARPYVSVHSWMDQSVIKPSPFAQKPAGQSYGGSSWGGTPDYPWQAPASMAQAMTGADFGFFPVRNNAGVTSPTGDAMYATDELKTRTPTLSARAPININTAPLPVLVAALYGLSVTYLNPGYQYYNADENGAALDPYWFEGFGNPTLADVDVVAATGSKTFDGKYYFRRMKRMLMQVPRGGVINWEQALGIALEIHHARQETFTDSNGNGFWDAQTPEPFVEDATYSNGYYDGPFSTWDQFKRFVEALPYYESDSQQDYGAQADPYNPTYNEGPIWGVFSPSQNTQDDWNENGERDIDTNIIDPGGSGGGTAPPAGSIWRGDWFRALPQSGTLVRGLNGPMKAALLANANPNTRYMNANPDACRLDFKVDARMGAAAYRPAVNHGFLTAAAGASSWNLPGPIPGQLPMGKMDLQSSTTEFCFGAMGYFNVEAMGVVLGPDGKVKAKSVHSTVFKLFEVARKTTQKDFMENNPNIVMGNTGDQYGTWNVASHPLNLFTTGAANWTDASARAATWDGHIQMEPSPRANTLTGTGGFEEDLTASFDDPGLSEYAYLHVAMVPDRGVANFAQTPQSASKSFGVASLMPSTASPHHGNLDVATGLVSTVEKNDMLPSGINFTSFGRYFADDSDRFDKSITFLSYSMEDWASGSPAGQGTHDMIHRNAAAFWFKASRFEPQLLESNHPQGMEYYANGYMRVKDAQFKQLTWQANSRGFFSFALPFTDAPEPDNDLLGNPDGHLEPSSTDKGLLMSFSVRYHRAFPTLSFRYLRPGWPNMTNTRRSGVNFWYREIMVSDFLGRCYTSGSDPMVSPLQPDMVSVPDLNTQRRTRFTQLHMHPHYEVMGGSQTQVQNWTGSRIKDIYTYYPEGLHWDRIGIRDRFKLNTPPAYEGGVRGMGIRPRYGEWHHCLIARESFVDDRAKNWTAENTFYDIGKIVEIWVDRRGMGQSSIPRDAKAEFVKGDPFDVPSLETQPDLWDSNWRDHAQVFSLTNPAWAQGHEATLHNHAGNWRAGKYLTVGAALEGFGQVNTDTAAIDASHPSPAHGAMMGFRLWTQKKNDVNFPSTLTVGGQGHMVTTSIIDFATSTTIGYPIYIDLLGGGTKEEYPLVRHLYNGWYLYNPTGFGAVTGKPRFDVSFSSAEIPAGSEIGSLSWTREVPLWDAAQHKLFLPPQHTRRYFQYWTCKRIDTQGDGDNYVWAQNNDSSRLGLAADLKDEMTTANSWDYTFARTGLLTDPNDRKPAPSMDVYGIMENTTANIQGASGRVLGKAVDNGAGGTAPYADGRGVDPVAVGLPVTTGAGGVSLRFVFRADPFLTAQPANWPDGNLTTAVLDDVTVTFKSPKGVEILHYEKN